MKEKEGVRVNHQKMLMVPSVCVCVCVRACVCVCVSLSTNIESYYAITARSPTLKTVAVWARVGHHY